MGAPWSGFSERSSVFEYTLYAVCDRSPSTFRLGVSWKSPILRPLYSALLMGQFAFRGSWRYLQDGGEVAVWRRVIHFGKMDI